MYIQNLILEVTRKCNFSCAHCLRGNAQNKNIDFAVIDALFNNNIDYIGMITFSGGEPSLYPEAINYFIDQCQSRGVEVGDFYIATNGGKSSGSLEFLTAVMRLYCFCSNNEMSQVEISKSDYHAGQQDEEAKKRLQCLRFAGERQHLDYRYLIHEGRAKVLNELNGTIDEARRIEPEKQLRRDEDENILTDELYINCKGDICLSCDLSYKRQDKNKIGNILTDRLEDLAVVTVE